MKIKNKHYCFNCKKEVEVFVQSVNQKIYSHSSLGSMSIGAANYVHFLCSECGKLIKKEKE